MKLLISIFALCISMTSLAQAESNCIDREETQAKIDVLTETIEQQTVLLSLNLKPETRETVEAELAGNKAVRGYYRGRLGSDFCNMLND